MTDAAIRWAKDAAEIVEFGAFFAGNAVRLPEYISHGEFKGIGNRGVRFIEAEMRSQNLDWLFLESGVRNDGAHKLFRAPGIQRDVDDFCETAFAEIKESGVRVRGSVRTPEPGGR